jgi:hypothetical protein
MKLFLKNSLILSTIFFIPCLWAQSLTQDQSRIRKISSTKKSVYFDQGIYVNSGAKIASTLNAVRHSYSANNGYERIVLDFKTNQVPKLYGYVSGKDKILHLDLFNSTVNPNINSFGNSKFVQSFNFFNFSDDMLSVEMVLKDNVNYDIFYLENPGRLVIDIKK